MRTLYQKFETLLQNTTTDFKRYLYEQVSWDSRMIGIIGARGVGKTTMILQYIKENLDNKQALYVSADDMYFGENRLVDLADDFYKNAGEYLFIDEIHKYTDWSRELKNIYDSFPALKVVFTNEIGRICKPLGIDAEEVVLSEIENAMDKYYRSFNLVNLNSLL